MLNITLIITIETVRIPPADRCSALRNVMISMMSSFTRPGGNNPPLFRLLPNSFRFSYDDHLLKRAPHFLSLSLFRGVGWGWWVPKMRLLERERLLYFLQP